MLRSATHAVAATLAALAGLMLCSGANAQSTDTTNDTRDQVVVPKVERRDMTLPKLPGSNDFEVGAFFGTYATQNFGASAVGGLRVSYHISEDFFAEAAFGVTEVSDDSFRQILPGGVFTDGKETLTYYNLSAGYNVLPGEVFLGGNVAKPTALYLIGGVGSTSFNQQRAQTFNVGFGWRVMLTDRYGLRIDLRDHIFTTDLLGERQSTQNLEFTVGASVFF